MKKFFVTLILMLSVFSIVSAHPFKSEKELYNYYAEIDKKINEELKNSPEKILKDRKNTLKPLSMNVFGADKVLGDNSYLFGFDKNGKIMSMMKRNVLDTPSMIARIYYSNGNLKELYLMDDDFVTGIVRTYYESGKKHEEIPYYKGKKEGLRKIYFENGNLSNEVHYFDDSREGKTTDYYSNGKVLRVKNYKNNMIDGEFTEYYRNGQIKVKGTYKDDLRDGEFKFYSENNKYLGSVFYKDKEIIKSTLSEEDKDEIWLLSDIGWIYNELDKYEEALQFLLRAEELGRNDAWLNAEIGQCLGRLEKLDEGIERLKKALEFLEKDKTNNTAEKIFVNSEIGWLIGKKEKSNPEEALYYLNIAKELGRDDVWINSEIAWELAYNDNKSEESIKYFERAIKLGRKDEWIWSRVANVYFDLGRIEDAYNAYSKAYKLVKNSWYICNVGRCLRKLGKYEEAVKKLLQSRKLSLKEGDVVDLEDLELAYCYAALGDKKKAEKHMKLSIDSLGSRAENEEHLKEQFDEIKEMISVLSKPS